MEWKKEYWLAVVIIVCLVLYYYKDKLGDEKYKNYLAMIPTIGGALFGLNTLIGLVK